MDLLKIVNKPGWKWLLLDNLAIIESPSEELALQLLNNSINNLIKTAVNLKGEVQIRWRGCKCPFQITAEMMEMENQPMSISNENTILLGADYIRIHEFLLEQRQSGNIVIITSNTNHQCYHTNDLLRPERGVYQPHQWTGYNYLNAWRETLNQLERLQSLLASDGVVKGYEYELYRPDNAFCTYQTDYYLCRDYLGDEVRIGVSRPMDWSILRQPEPAVQ